MPVTRCTTLRRFTAAFVELALLAASLLFAGCRLYEPDRYARLTFSHGAPSTRVLMIGDSLTYYNDLPGLLQQLSARQPAPIDIRQVTAPLRSLNSQWNDGRALRLIRQEHFDYVILQEYSRRPITDPADSTKYFALFDAEVRQAGGRTIIFQNWTRRGYDGDYAPLLATYRQIQQQTHAPLAPIGAAWRDCATRQPQIALLLDDRHPADAGTYLAACVLFDILYHQRSAALPLDLPAPPLAPDVIRTLRDIADRAVAAQPP